MNARGYIKVVDIPTEGCPSKTLVSTAVYTSRLSLNQPTRRLRMPSLKTDQPSKNTPKAVGQKWNIIAEIKPTMRTFTTSNPASIPSTAPVIKPNTMGSAKKPNFFRTKSPLTFQSFNPGIRANNQANGAAITAAFCELGKLAVGLN